MKPFKLFSLYMIAAVLLAASINCNFAYKLLGKEEEPVQSVEGVLTPGPPLSKATEIVQEAAPTQPPKEVEKTSPEPEVVPPLVIETCAEEICMVEGTFLLGRPIGPDGRNTIDYANRFGEYRRVTKSAHHGSDFLNSTGTPVLAAADGIVLVAGNDSENLYGKILNEYGNLIVIEHSVPGLPSQIYTLYAHLDQVFVRSGDAVTAGEEIGLVGMSGSVTGSTLHFEVRLGENSYQSARNPELWLKLLEGEDGLLNGGLAGRIIDGEGEFVHMPNIVLERLGGPGAPALDRLYLKTYTDTHIAGQPPWGENFGAGGLIPGEYQISFWLDEMRQKIVEIEPGKLTIVTFMVE